MKSPYKSIVKPIMNEGDKSAFKMKGYSYPGISPLKQKELPTTQKEPSTVKEKWLKSRYGKHLKKSLTVPSLREKELTSDFPKPQHHYLNIDKTKKIKSFVPRPNLKDVVTQFSPSAPGYKGEVGKVGFTMAAQRIFTPKKEEKKATRIVPKNWKKIV